jgi:hypothetical protein
MTRRRHIAWLALLLLGAVVPGCRREEPARAQTNEAAPAAVAAAVDLPIPATAINRHVVALAWIDVSQATAESALASWLALWPPRGDESAGMYDAVTHRLQGFAHFREAFLDAGGEAIVLGLLAVEQPDEPGMFLMIRVRPGTEPAVFQAAIDAAMNAPATTSATLYTPDWLQVRGTQLAAVPADGSVDAAAALLAPLQLIEHAPLRVVLRLSDDARRWMELAGRRLAPALLDPLLGLDTAAVAVSLGERPRLTSRLQFTNERAAETFNAVYDALMQRGRAALNVSADPAIERAFGELTWRRDGDTLSMALDEAFVQSAHRLTPVLTPLMLSTFGPQRMQPAAAAMPQ